MTPTHCISCGSEVPDHAEFCHACGSAVYRPENKSQPPEPAPAESPVPEAGTNISRSDLPTERYADTLRQQQQQQQRRQAPVATDGVEKFDLHVDAFMGALGLAFRSLGLWIAMEFVIPSPWILCWFCGWLVRQVRLGGRRTLEFRGTPGGVAILAISWGVIFFLFYTRSISQLNSGRESSWLDMAIILAMLMVQWAIYRWVINHTQLEGRSLRFDGSLYACLGWSLAISFSLITIIGWAWIYAAVGRWTARHIQGAGGKIRFVGKGHQILWRGVVTLLLSLLIVTIPWVMRWITRWWIGQYELERDTPSMQV